MATPAARPAAAAPAAIQWPGLPNSININQILPGDLIFEWDGQKCGHAAIYTGANTQAHAIFRSVDVPGARETSLRPNPAFRILRCRNDELRAVAAGYAKHWAEYIIPYSRDRLDTAQLMDAQPAPSGLVAKHRELFEKAGKFRAIKYAARRKGFLCYPHENRDQGPGLTCGMFVALCYQVAGIAKFVFPAPDTPLYRVSDKRMQSQELKMFQAAAETRAQIDWELYSAYCATLNEANPYQLCNVESCYVTTRTAVRAPKPKSALPGGARCYPGIVHWIYKDNTDIATFPWAKRTTLGMMLDSKVVMPASLLACLLVDSEGWQDLGMLEGAAPTFSEQQRAEYKNQQGAMVAGAQAHRNNFLGKK